MVTLLIDDSGNPVKADDQSTFGVDVTFTDTDGSAVTPHDGLVWTLTDHLGNVINNRLNEAIDSAPTVTVPLSGDDLKYSDAVERVVTIVGTYDSQTLGSNLPIRKQVRFSIEEPVTVVTP